MAVDGDWEVAEAVSGADGEGGVAVVGQRDRVGIGVHLRGRARGVVSERTAFPRVRVGIGGTDGSRVAVVRVELRERQHRLSDYEVLFVLPPAGDVLPAAVAGVVDEFVGSDGRF